MIKTEEVAGISEKKFILSMRYFYTADNIIFGLHFNNIGIKINGNGV